MQEGDNTPAAGKKAPRVDLISISLGPEPLRSERIHRLDALAASLGVSRSGLVQLIADGRVSLTLIASRIGEEAPNYAPISRPRERRPTPRKRGEGDSVANTPETSET